jgi:hypothetical protein
MKYARNRVIGLGNVALRSKIARPIVKIEKLYSARFWVSASASIYSSIEMTLSALDDKCDYSSLVK